VAKSHRITEVTRRRICDIITIEKIDYAGRLQEIDFLRRLYDLSSIPSSYPNYANVERDIRRHRFNNDDWEGDWIFHDGRFGLVNGPDEQLLAFLAEMLHPVVRSDETEVQRLLTLFNAALAGDGYELVQDGAISGLPIFAGRSRSSFHGSLPKLNLDKRALLTDPQVLHEHLDRIRRGVESDPAAAIGSCKELIESLFKIILDRSGVEYPRGEDVPALYRRVAELLALKTDSVPTSAKGSQTSKKILGTLATTVQSLAELRNELGLGHGRTAPSPALARHARLALNSTVTVAEFLLDTWQERVDKGIL
jgi:hypothetical protein